MISAEPVHEETNIDGALQFLNQVQKRRCVSFLLSDFQSPASRHALAVSNGRHDLVAITVVDRREQQLPAVGFLRLRDAESGEIVEVDTRHPRIREMFETESARRSDELSTLLRRAGVDQLQVSSTEPYATSLRKFFLTRERRLR